MYANIPSNATISCGYAGHVKAMKRVCYVMNVLVTRIMTDMMWHSTMLRREGAVIVAMPMLGIQMDFVISMADLQGAER